MTNGTVPIAAALEGQWRVTEIRDATIPPGTVIDMTFRDGRVWGVAGCSSYDATAATEGNDLNLGMIRYSSTECADDVMQAGSDFARALGLSGRYEVDAEGRLTLFSAMFPLIRAERVATAP